jgi:hypothetical protein
MRFRNDPPGSLRRYANLFGLADTSDVVSEAAPVSVSELQTAATQLRAALDASNIEYVLEPDERQGRLVVAVTSSALLDAAVASGQVVLPAFVTRQVRQRLFESTAYVVGGVRVRAVSSQGNPSGCTLSFAVRDASNVRGLTSAGHCDDATVRADGINPATPNIVLSAGLGQRTTNGYDFQWHSFSSTHVASPSIDLKNGTFQPIRRYATTASIQAGLVVNVVGASTGRLMQATVAYGGVTLSGYGCCFFRITPVHCDDILAIQGDSGGAVFTSDMAIGIVVARATDIQNDAYFMPIQQVTNAGLTIIAAQ